MSLTASEAVFDYLQQNEALPGNLLSVHTQDGGFTSYTYRIKSSEGIFFLKYNANHKKGAPHLTNDPAELAYEAAAYDVIGDYIDPKTIPKRIMYDNDKHVLLLSDALPGVDTTLKDVVHEPRWPLEVAANIGQLIGSMHGRAAMSQPVVRPPEIERAHYNYLVKWLSSDLHFNNPQTQELIEHKAAAGSSHETLIMGDLAPRNILANTDVVAFVDLARVTRGSPSFDIGYLAGHLLLNAIEFEQLPRANAFLEKLRAHYELGVASTSGKDYIIPDAVFEESKVFAAGWMHRRTFQPHQAEDIPERELREVESYICKLAVDGSFGY